MDHPRTPGSPNQVPVLAQTRSVLNSLVSERVVPGVSYLQVAADQVLLDAHWGLADVATKRSLSPSTMYMAYSTTKVLTAIAVLQLSEQDKLELDAPLSRYFTDHPYGQQVTVRMLLAHTAGVPNPIPADWFFLEGDEVQREAALRVALGKHGRRAARAGAKYAYSNLGYWLLEKVVESASSMAYPDYLQGQVFGPLGLSEADVSFDLPSADRLATGHGRRWSLVNALLYAMAPSRYWIEPKDGWSRIARLQSHGLGYGGAYVTTRAFGAVLTDLLKSKSCLLGDMGKSAMFERQKLPGGRPLEGTLGWVVGSLDGEAYFGKQGGGLGFHGNVRLYPQLGLATAFFANSTEVSAGPIDKRGDLLDGPMVRLMARRIHQGRG